MALFAFEGFILDTDDRRLKADGQPVELNARYFDALALMAREQGRLVSKERFLSEVWDGVPVTDEALTQCIKTLRRQLGDEAGRPRFIETVPKHGYRFIAPVEVLGSGEATDANVIFDHWLQFVVSGAAGTLGGLAAGVIGGLIYGFLAASQGVASGGGLGNGDVAPWLAVSFAWHFMSREGVLCREGTVVSAAAVGFLCRRPPTGMNFDGR